uniref:C2H2-type domain-containing protein n=1 Tax=Timema shepardi TaxID=629360 RepID=A0A7R9ALL7_TIMSH|nr:unnamed protein product [Timema shepardi]
MREMAILSGSLCLVCPKSPPPPWLCVLTALCAGAVEDVDYVIGYFFGTFLDDALKSQFYHNISSYMVHDKLKNEDGNFNSVAVLATLYEIPSPTTAQASACDNPNLINVVRPYQLNKKKFKLKFQSSQGPKPQHSSGSNHQHSQSASCAGCGGPHARVKNTSQHQGGVHQIQEDIPLFPVQATPSCDLYVVNSSQAPARSIVQLEVKSIPLTMDVDTVASASLIGSVFIVLELTQAYQQLKLGPASQEILTLSTPYGPYKCLFLPDGLSSASAIFQSVITIHASQAKSEGGSQMSTLLKQRMKEAQAKFTIFQGNPFLPRVPSYTWQRAPKSVNPGVRELPTDSTPKNLRWAPSVMASAHTPIYEADPLPEMICHKCLFKLEEAYDFQQKCMEVNATMLRHLQPFSQQRSVQQYLALAGRHHRQNSLNHSDDMSTLDVDHIETKLQPDSPPPRPANTGNTFQEVFLEEFSTDSFFSEVVLEDSLQETMDIAQNSPQLPPAPPTPPPPTPPPPPPASLPETSLLQPTCLQSPTQPNLWSLSQIKKEPGLGSVVQHKTPSGVHITLQQTAPVAATIVRANPPPAHSNPPSARSNPSLAQSNPPSTNSNPSLARSNPPTRSNPFLARSSHPACSNPSPARSNPPSTRSNPPSTRSNPPPASSNSAVTPPIASPQPSSLKNVPLDIKPRKCKTCHFASTSREEMDQHLCSFQMSWQCNICQKYFYNKGNLLRHKGVCKSKSYKCTQCRLNFGSLEKMAQHRIIHTKVLAYVRDEDMSVCSCGKKFGCKMMMRIHKRYHHSYPRTESPAGASIRNGTDRFSGKVSYTYTCNFCRMDFDNAVKLKIHKKMHYRHNELLSKKKKRDALKAAAEVDHVNDAEAKAPPQIDKEIQNRMGHFMPGAWNNRVCNLCGMGFDNERKFKNHKRMHYRLRRSMAKKERKNLEAEQTKGPEASEPAPPTMTKDSKTWFRKCNCKYCGEEFPNSSALIAHMRQKHALMKPTFKCEECHKVIMNRGGYITHIKSHKVCKVCLKLFSSLDHLAYGGVPKRSCHKCLRCNSLKFTTRPAWLAHCKMHAASKLGRLSSTIVNASRAAVVPCSFCNEMFPDPAALVSHLEIHVGNSSSSMGATMGEATAEPNKVNPLLIYSCTTCGNAFSSKDAWTRHQKMHATGRHKYYPCKICGKKFISLETFQAHSANHTSSNQPEPVPAAAEAGPEFPCKRCPFSCFSQQALNSHMRIHASSKPAGELVNNGQVKVNSTRKKMVLVKTSNGYKCSVCPKVFPNHYAGASHVRSHLQGPKNYICPLCPKKYKDSEILYKHIYLDHPDNRH